MSAALVAALVVSLVMWLGLYAVVCLALAFWPAWLALAVCLVALRYEP